LSTAWASQDVPFLEQKDVRHRTLKNFVIQSMSRHFTMDGSDANFKWEREGFPTKFFEMKGFTMKPQIQRITEADRLNGVDLKFTLILQCTAHREKISLGTYGDWSNGPPSVFWLPIPI